VGPADILRDGVNGFVFSCGDTKALKAAMERLMTEPETYRSFSARAREIASEQDASVAALKFIDAFERVLASQRPSVLTRARTVIPFLESRSEDIAGTPHRDNIVI